MPTIGYQWSDWTTLADAEPVSHGGQWSSAAIDLDGQVACEIAVICQYVKQTGAIVQGAKAYVLRASGEADYETADDGPWGFELPFADQDCVRRRSFAVDPGETGGLKLLLTYNGGANTRVLLTLRHRTATLHVA